MKRLLLTLVIAAAGLSACSTYRPFRGPPPPAPPPRETPFRAEDFAWSQAPGGAAIRGAVVFQGLAGGYSCVGASVALIPDTAYSRGRIVRLYGVADRAAIPIGVVRARRQGRVGEAYAAFARTARCGADGAFAFERLPPGAWFLVATAKPLDGKADTMVLLRRVRTRPGQQLRLVLE